MKPTDLLSIIRQNLDDNSEIELTSPTMYDPDELDSKVSFAILQSVENGTIMKFKVTVEDLTKK